MDKQEIDQFLAGIKMAVMATINKDGSPHLSPNWYYYDGDKLMFVTTKERLKFFNLRRDDRMSVCVYEPPLASDPLLQITWYFRVERRSMMEIFGTMPARLSSGMWRPIRLTGMWSVGRPNPGSW